jgi:magnesium chelatase subunit D
MVAFRGRGAELLLPPTNSVDLAQACLAELPTGGRTPLGHGLQLGVATLDRQRGLGREVLPLLVVVSDGRANVPLFGGDPLDELWTIGAEIQRRRLHTILVDAAVVKARFGFAAEAARALGAAYIPIDQLAAGSLAGAARRAAAAAWQRWGRA